MLYYLCNENKEADQMRCSAFVFAYAKSSFSHDVAQLLITIYSPYLVDSLCHAYQHVESQRINPRIEQLSFTKKGIEII